MCKYKIQINLNNVDNLNRINEPVITKLNFTDHKITEETLALLDDNDQKVNFQLIDKVVENGYLLMASMVYLVNMKKDELVKSYYLISDSKIREDNLDTGEQPGIQFLKPIQSDGFRRLDTGHYILELCAGTGDGTSYGKWGIRYFEAKNEGENLIKNYSNAIGGFYGPFFTPANGLINPPEHTAVDITVEEEGPLYCRYRFNGTVPNGLDPNLFNKDFSIIWEFFYNSSWFRRTYHVDEFSTVVDGMPVENVITVGDEFEAGPGNRAFTRFASYGGTYYRQGDPYAEILYDGVYKLLDEADEESNPKIKRYRDSIGQDLQDASWDYFWRLFCIKEGILTDQEIKNYISQIIPEAHKVVHMSSRNEEVIFSKEPIDVNSKPNQTIFPIGSNKSTEINDSTGYSIVWYTNNVSAKHQIVQRNDSGWVNWGTNGENEYPTLPIGTTIYTAYDRFDDWEEVADAMEKNIDSKQGMIFKIE